MAASMYPLTQSLLVSIYPPAKRGVALSILAMVTVVAPIAGPILGAWITDAYSWKWIFFINVPIGILASSLVFVQIGARPDQTEKARIDVVGLLTLILGVGSLQTLLDKGNQLDWFSSGTIVALAIVSAISIAIFLIWELTDREPIVDLRLFRHRNFAVGTLALVLAYAAFFSINLLVPLWLQDTLGYTSLWAGLASAPIGVIPVLLTFWIGKSATRAAKRRLPKRARVPLYVPRHPDTVWSPDFMSDALACGRHFRTFNVDDFNCEVVHIDVDTSITSTRLVHNFEQIRRDHGLPQVLRTDNGPEFLAKASCNGPRPTAWLCGISSLKSPTKTPISSVSIGPCARRPSSASLAPLRPVLQSSSATPRARRCRSGARSETQRPAAFQLNGNNSASRSTRWPLMRVSTSVRYA